MHARAAHHTGVSRLEDADVLLGVAIRVLSDKTPRMIEAFRIEGSAARTGAWWAGRQRTGVSLQAEPTT